MLRIFKELLYTIKNIYCIRVITDGNCVYCTFRKQLKNLLLYITFILVPI